MARDEVKSSPDQKKKKRPVLAYRQAMLTCMCTLLSQLCNYFNHHILSQLLLDLFSCPNYRITKSSAYKKKLCRKLRLIILLCTTSLKRHTHMFLLCFQQLEVIAIFTFDNIHFSFVKDKVQVNYHNQIISFVLSMKVNHSHSV